MPARTSCPAALPSPTQRESPLKETPRPRPPAAAAVSSSLHQAAPEHGSTYSMPAQREGGSVQASNAVGGGLACGAQSAASSWRTPARLPPLLLLLPT